MHKRRLIPVLFLQDGLMVRSENFALHQVIGNPVSHVNRLVEWDVDELILLDIGKGEEAYDIGRDDHGERGAVNLLEFTTMIAENCAIPLTLGGRIRNIDDVRVRIQYGADKICLNTVVAEDPALITRSAHSYGSQAIVISIDYRIVDGAAQVFTEHATKNTGVDPVTWSQRCEELGAGEIFLNAVDRDGNARGYDLEIIDEVARAVTIPVIACGGAGHQMHFNKCFEETAASAVAAGNIFHFTENAYPRAKKYLRGKRDDIR
jgi:imidazole glycerol-phosphate synthase subunit HisF